MFDKSARYYDVLYSWKNYDKEVEQLLEVVRAKAPGAKSLLDVACGTGKHLELFDAHFDVAGVDLDEELLRQARERCPEVPLHHADMRTFDLGTKFDVVTCLFSSIGYMKTEDDLQQAISTMAHHLAPDGVLIVEPWFAPDRWQAGIPFALYVDEPDIKIARLNVNGPVGSNWNIEFHYLVATHEGVSFFSEHHEGGFFTVEQQMSAYRQAGLEPEHDPEGPMGRGLFIACHQGQ